ncbi:MFS transporter [Hirschia litorea]|uniref:MFS transporter n=1 Tax=Hirschia litorea TaxID=1199156 RepID=A0ABW2INN5_9PROT
MANLGLHLSISTDLKRKIGMWLLLVAVGCTGSGQTMLFAILPPLARDLGLKEFQVGTIFTLSAIVFTLAGPWCGRKSDQYGRRPFILLGMAGFVLSTFAFAGLLEYGILGGLHGVTLYIVLMLVRSVSGLFSAASASASTAYIADRTPLDQRASGMAKYAAAYGLGTVLGPASAGYLSVFGAVMPLFIMAAIGAITFALLGYFLVEETPPKAQKESPRMKISDNRIFRLLGFNLLSGCAISIPVQIIGFYIIDAFNMSPDDAQKAVGTALTASAISSLAGQIILIQKLKLPPSRLMAIGPLGLVIGNSFISASSTFEMLLVGMFITGLGSGLLMPGTIAAISMRISPTEQGSASGLAIAAGAIGFIFSPVFAFGLYNIHTMGPFIFVGALGAIMMLPFWRAQKIDNISQSPPPIV